MKLLLENWRKYLNEGMKVTSDLPSDAVIVIAPDPEERAPGSKMIYYAWRNPETGKINPPSTGKSRAHPNIYGEVTIVPLGDRCPGVWESHSNANPGWGPLLYDVAMEYTTLNGNGLVSSREGSSPDAQKVWNYYLSNRPDVEPHQLDDERNTLTPDDSDNCAQIAMPTGREGPGGYSQGDDRSAGVNPERQRDWLLKNAFSKRYTKTPSTIRAFEASGQLEIIK